MATPLATPISKALKDQPLTEVVRAILAIADTLAALHAENVSHRDVKPSNLYQYMGRWVVGDLGLIDFPDKDSITETGERLGPMNFLAPEMLDDGKHAEGAQADVYSLAKTLWVLSTGQRVPPPGELRAGNTQTSIGAYVAHSGGPQLDVLIERATRYAPTARPTMDEIARELSAWLTPSSPSGTPDTARLLAALRARATTFHEVQESRQKESQKMFHLLQLVRTQMANIASAFAETGLSDRQIKYDDGLFLLTDAGVSQPAGGADSFNAQGLVIAASTRGPGYRVGLNCLISTSLRGDGTTLVRGGYVVEWGKSKPELIGYQEHVVASGSAIERNTLTTLIANLCQTLPAALTAFLGFIGRGEAPHPSLDIAAW
ncbi:MAG: protein kinase [Gemmataceae bacterium]